MIIRILINKFISDLGSYMLKRNTLVLMGWLIIGWYFLLYIQSSEIYLKFTFFWMMILAFFLIIITLYRKIGSYYKGTFFWTLFFDRIFWSRLNKLRVSSPIHSFLVTKLSLIKEDDLHFLEWNTSTPFVLLYFVFPLVSLIIDEVWTFPIDVFDGRSL